MVKFKTDAEKAKFLEDMFNLLKAIRLPYEEMIDEVIRFVNHSRRSIKVEGNSQKGKNTGVDVYDGTALAAANLAADGIHGYMCSSNIHWFDFTLPGRLNFPRTSGMRQWSGKRMDEYPEVKVWLDECEEVAYAAFLRSNFYEWHPGYIKEGITIGTPTALIEEDVGAGRIIFTMPHFRECYIAEDQFGVVDTLYRNYKISLKNLVQKFGQDKVFSLNTQFKGQYEKDPYAEKECLHAIFPRTDYDPSQADSKNKPVASIYMLMDGHEKKILGESGYDDIPTVTWRWRKNNDEIYGRTPAWDAYVDIAQANQMGRTNLIASHKMVEPPMVAPEDLRGKVNNTPDGWTWIDGSVTKDKMPLPLNTNIQLPFTVEMQDRVGKAIKEHFHVDFFLMLYQAAFNKVDLTATQVIGMQGEQAAVLGTRIGRHQSEALNPIMDRVFNIEVRAGRMPELPQILQDTPGTSIEVDYVGPLSQAQKRLFKTQSIRAGLELGAQISQVFPSSADIIDGDIAMKEALESVGFPAKAFRDPKTVKQIREIRQKDEAAAKDLEAIEGLAKAGQKLTKKIEEGSPLDALTGGEA